MCFPGALLSSFLTPLIAIITIAILVLQYRLERQRWILGLFDKRYPVFLRTMEYLKSATETMTADRLFQFLRDTRDKEFLFQKEVHEFLDLLYRKGTDLETTQTLLRTPRQLTDLELKTRAEQENELKVWFGDQFDTAKQIFRPYLKLDYK